MTKQTVKFVEKSKKVANWLLVFIGSKKFRYIIIAWFVLQVGFMAMTTAKGIAPDEGTHMRTVMLYANDGFDPFIQNQPPDAYQLGAVTRSPSYMYHYLMSFPYRMLPNSWAPDSQLVALRLVNVIFSVLGVIVFSRVLGLLTKKGTVQNLTLFMLTNTLMFTFLASSLNYDNLIFLMSSVSLLYFVKLLGRFKLLDLIKLGAAIMFAILVKFTFLPLGALFVGLLLFRYRSELKSVWKQGVADVRKPKKPLIVFSILFVVLFGLFMERYAVNHVRYGSFKPQCDRVVSYEQCLSSGLFVRNLEFRDNPIVDRTPDPGFVGKWALRMKEGVYGILGHKFADETLLIKYGSALVLLVMLIAFIRTVGGKQDRILYYLLFIVTIYVVSLIINNHNLYQKSGRFGLALQGRYIFPVIGIIYFIGNYYVEKMLRKSEFAYVGFAIIAMGIFFASSLPTYILVIDEGWRMSAMNSINVHIKTGIRLLLP